ncbi:MAG: ferrochelatase [Isosphaeraceae bacterium]
MDPYDALLIVGFGGPEGPDEVMPFLENVLRGRNVPRERMLEVAEHYHHFGGVSPINGQVRDLIEVLRPELDRRGIKLPIYWGNRNWRPMLGDTLRQMADDGIRRALAVVLSGYSSYSGCRQYREDIARAREGVEGPCPAVDKMRVFYNHPDFIAANADRIRESGTDLSGARILFTAHSIPSSMAAGCDYEKQLAEACRLVAEELGTTEWDLVYQSRSGRPQDPWLGPDILDHLRNLHSRGISNVVVHPVGFLSDHMEVLYDLDEEARILADSLGMTLVRTATVGTHPLFVSMLGELIAERVEGRDERRATGLYGPNHDVCPVDCCPAPARPRA